MAKSHFQLRRALMKLTIQHRNLRTLIEFSRSALLHHAFQYQMSIVTVPNPTDQLIVLPGSQEEWRDIIDNVCMGYYRQGEKWEDEEAAMFQRGIKKLTWNVSPHCECALIEFLTNEKRICKKVQGGGGGGACRSQRDDIGSSDVQKAQGHDTGSGGARKPVKDGGSGIGRAKSQRNAIDRRGIRKSQEDRVIDMDAKKSQRDDITARGVQKPESLRDQIGDGGISKPQGDDIGISGVRMSQRDNISCGGFHKCKRDDIRRSGAQKSQSDSESSGMGWAPGGAARGGVPIFSQSEAQHTTEEQKGLATLLPISVKGAGQRILKREEGIASLKPTAVGGGRGALSWSAIAAKGNLGGESVIKVGEVRSKSGKAKVLASQKKESSVVVGQQHTPKNDWTSVAPFSYIGVSKLNCYPCSLWIKGFNSLETQKFYTKGCHGKWYWPWVMPRIESDQVGEFMAERISEKYIQTLRREQRLRTSSDTTVDSQDETESAWSPSKLDDLKNNLLAQNP